MQIVSRRELMYGSASLLVAASAGAKAQGTADWPTKPVQGLVAYAKQNPGKLSWGNPGVGTYGHLICETFKAEAGVDILHVPYRGTGEAMTDFLAGAFQIHADPVTLPHVVAGKAR